jgi:hypothetical protein
MTKPIMQKLIMTKINMNEIIMEKLTIINTITKMGCNLLA